MEPAAAKSMLCNLASTSFMLSYTAARSAPDQMCVCVDVCVCERESECVRVGVCVRERKERERESFM